MIETGSRSRAPRRSSTLLLVPVVVAPVIASSLLLGACGGGGQASGSSPVTATDAAVTTTSPMPAHSGRGNSVLRLNAPRSREEKQAYRTAAGLYRALAVTSSGGAAAAVRFLLRRSKQDGSLTAPNSEHVVGVEIDGETATVTARAAGGKTTYLGLVKEDGLWRLARLG
jgi:hypothetical protein